MNIAYNGRFLREGLLAAGHRIYDLEFGERDALASLLDKAPYPIDLVFCEFFGGFSERRLFAACEYPIAGYFIDSPINEFWIRHAAKNLDYVFGDQIQSAEALRERGIDARWAPLPAQKDYFQPPREKKYDLTFIGRVDKERLKRNNLLNLIKSSFPINIMSGLSIPEAQKVFSESRIVLNENFFPGLTLRVLQGLSAGSVVFTEKSPYGHDFGLKSGEDLVLYDSANILDLVSDTLANYNRYSRIAENGRSACESLYSAERVARDILATIGVPEKKGGSPPEELEWNRIRAETQFAFRFGGNLGGIARSCRTLAIQYPQRSVDSLLVLGDIQARIGKKEDAKASYLKAFEIAPGSFAPLKLALLDIERKDADAALKSIRRWMESRPDMSSLADKYSRADATPETALSLVAEIYFSLGKKWDMGFAKSFVDPVPDSAFELASMAWKNRPSSTALDLMSRCLKPYHMEGELLPWMLSALKRGELSGARILETARLAYDYYDRETAEAILKATRKGG